MTSPDLAIAVGRADGLGMLTGTVGHDSLTVHLGTVPSDATGGLWCNQAVAAAWLSMSASARSLYWAAI